MILSKLLIMLVIWPGFFSPEKFSLAQKRKLPDEKIITISANELHNLFEENENLGNSICLNKILKIDGKVSKVAKNINGTWEVLFIMDEKLEGVSCLLKKQETIKNIQEEKNIFLTGKCKGLLGHVRLIDCTLE